MLGVLYDLTCANGTARQANGDNVRCGRDLLSRREHLGPGRPGDTAENQVREVECGTDHKGD
jgi:hypothetical protein